MGKILLNTFLHRLILTVIAGLVAKHQIDARTATALMNGDTAPLYAGGIPINVNMIVQFLSVVAIPNIISWLLAVWRRIKYRFQVLAASRSEKTLTQEQVKEITKDTPNLTIIKTVANANKTS